MPVFRLFFKILRKNKVGIAIYTVIFIAISVLFSINGAENNENMFQSTNTNIAVINRDEGNISEYIKNFLDKDNTIVELEDDKEKMQDELFYRNIDYIP